MEITWYGLSCFRITERKHATVVTDPFGKTFEVRQPTARFDAFLRSLVSEMAQELGLA